MLTFHAVIATPRSRPWDESLDPPLDWLERANRHALVTRLVSSAVHDVSNALQVVSGAAEMLALDAGSEAVSRRSAAIVHQAMGATTVLQQLTGFAREPLRPAEPISLRALGERVVAWRQYSLRKLRVASQVAGDEGECRAPVRRLLQVLLNLVVNAEQGLAGRGEGRLTVTVSSAADHVDLVVADDGPGLDDAMRRAVLLWPPPADPASGALGIGLLVSHHLVQQMGGRLSLGASADGGLAVQVRLRR
jgi:two-component system C4-dicarboxylate transport sensor histidine kinase DctB